MRRGASGFSFGLPIWAALALAAAACNLDNPGDDPPAANIYFPVAIGLSTATATTPARFLYLVNSNFDLRYNAGTVQAYDLDELNKSIAKQCVNITGAKCIIAPADVLADEVWIPSFASGMSISTSGQRLYIPTRADDALSFVDVDETSSHVLRCGESATRPRCALNYERGSDSVQNARRLRMPDEPVAVTSGSAADLAKSGEIPLGGDFVMVAHRLGQVSLFLDNGLSPSAASAGNGPVLTDVLANLPQELTGIAFDPVTHFAYASVYDRTSGVAQASPKVLARVGVAGIAAAPDQSLLYNVGALQLDGISIFRDTRALAFRSASPGEALVVSRDPAALLWVDIGQNPNATVAPGHVRTRLAVDLDQGPSRMTTGVLAGIPVAVVSCFDAREIFVLQADTGAVLSIVHNLSGPFEVALDAVRQRLYVADFRASVVRVIDLSPIADANTLGGTVAAAGSTVAPTSAFVLATLGHRKLIEELQ